MIQRPMMLTCFFSHSVIYDLAIYQAKETSRVDASEWKLNKNLILRIKSGVYQCLRRPIISPARCLQAARTDPMMYVFLI